MDVVRSCYVGKMRFRESDNPVSVKWFFANPQAKIFTAPTVFRGADFEQTPYSNSGIGTQRPPRGTYYNGKAIPLLDGKSEEEHWPLSWWLEGIPEGVTVSIPRAPSGAPLLCLPKISGVLLGGSAVVSVHPVPDVAAGVLLGGSAVVGSGSVGYGGVVVDGEAIVSSS